ncbi:LTA synthase family protein [Xanthomonas dyei]|uniref:LTA synthase family protein n=1 Tax=Xanthomonas dyei TaxID=743699 RepID=UPI001304B0DC|nr:LTA synthase family protein [Xanthomonas dyei]
MKFLKPKQTPKNDSIEGPRRIVELFDWISIVAAVWVINVVIDPYISISSPLEIQWPNTAIPILLTLALCAATRRPVFAVTLIASLQLVINWIDSEKILLLNSHLVYADLLAARTFLGDPALSTAFVRISAIGVAVLIALVGAALWLSWEARQLHKTTTLCRLTIITFSCFFAILLVIPNSPIPLPDSSWNPFDESEQTTATGINGNILRGARAYGRTSPTFDPSAIAPLLRLAGAHWQITGLQPDIIIVQSESLFEPSILCGMPIEPYLKGILNSSSQVGILIPPTFGGRTLQTEFEAISGIPTKPFSSQFSYIDLLKNPIESLASTLSKAGYQTVAIHPNIRTYWRRDFAMPMLGFDTFIDSEAFSDRDVGKWKRVSELSLMETALSEIESASRPTMAFVVTIQNHGPWGKENAAAPTSPQF